MEDTEGDELGAMLEEGWEIIGYTVNMLAAGAQHYNILLRKDNSLINFGVLRNGGVELGRGKQILTPFVKQEKKGWFG